MVARRRNPARWLAPLALIACAAAVYAVVHDDDPTTARKPAAGASRRPGAATSPARRATTAARGRRRIYTVRPGDTLSSIAVKTGIPLATIQRLNPKLDAQSLHAGEKVKLTASSP
jgi:predicted Zn-dependent protease